MTYSLFSWKFCSDFDCFWFTKSYYLIYVCVICIYSCVFSHILIKIVNLLITLLHLLLFLIFKSCVYVTHLYNASACLIIFIIPNFDTSSVFYNNYVSYFSPLTYFIILYHIFLFSSCIFSHPMKFHYYNLNQNLYKMTSFAIYINQYFSLSLTYTNTTHTYIYHISHIYIDYI